MIKKLTLIRHAKSSWKYANLADEDRPLNKRGRHDAPVMGKRLAASGLTFERMITSPALRALRTAQAIAAAVELPPEQLRVAPQLYGVGIDQLLDYICGLDDTLQSVALVGHNPEFSFMIQYLSGRPVGHVPTCAVATIHLETKHWHRVRGNGAPLVDFEFDFPKNLTS